MSTDAQNVTDRLDRLEANAPEGEPFTDDPTSIGGARDEAEDASGYRALVAEVEAMEARVSDRTEAAVREAVVALRNKVERPPLNEDGSNSINSPVVRKENVDRVRAVARDLAPKV